MTTTIARAWRVPPATRAGLAERGPIDSELWDSRLRVDRARALENSLNVEVRRIASVVEERSRALGAEAVVLTGSTARRRRTPVSDLDFHVIGARPQVDDLPADLDLLSDSSADFAEKLERGDDFAHWTVRYGCVLFDTGVMREMTAHVASHVLWPDPERKLRQARRTLEFAEQLVESGDYAASLEQVRGALSLTARWWLLAHDVFPLARDELSEQLTGVGEGADQPVLARTLHDTIHQRPDSAALTAAIAQARSLTG